MDRMLNQLKVLSLYLKNYVGTTLLESVINNGNNMFSEVESVIASTNSNDSKPMLNLFDIEINSNLYFNTIISNEFAKKH
jgi:hypothetical protein